MRMFRGRKSVVAIAGAASMLLSGCGFHGLYGVSLPGGASLGDHPYSIIIYFSNVLDLVPQSAVKVNDVAVGRVEDVRLSKTGDASGDAANNGWTARVKISVNGSVHLPSNSRADIQQTSLLGEKFVALEAPSSAPAATFLTNNSTIPLSNTGSAPEVETVLGALSLLLNDGGLAQLHIITTELNKALGGNEPALRDLLVQLNTFTGQLDTQKGQITHALDQINSLSATLAAQTTTIANTLDTLPKALKILADDRQKLTQLLLSLSDLGSVAGQVIDATSTTLTRALVNLSPALEELTAAGSNLPKALKIAGTFPFPLGKSLEAVRGDYANLHLFLDLNLVNELCGIIPFPKGTADPLCSVGSGLSNTITPQVNTSVASDTVTEPTLIGLGG